MILLASAVASLVVSLVLTPAVRAGARSLGLVAVPSADRWHKKPTALFGGIAIFAGFLAGLAAMVVSGGAAAEYLRHVPREAVGIVLGAILMFVTGLVDDRFGMRPATKLILQGAAASVIVSLGVVYPLTSWAVVNVVVTLLWFMAITNAVNLLDNMDGVSAGVTAVAALFMTATFMLEGETLLAAVAIAVAGAVIGFLPYNFHPASIFMGDSGSLFLGALLASLGAAYPATASNSIAPVLFLPVVLVAIPILDTTLVTLTRTLAGRPISAGGRDHTSHRLVAMGLSEPQAAMLLYGFAALGGLVAMAVRQMEIGLGLFVTAIFLSALLIPAAYLSRLHTYSPPPGGSASAVTVLVSNLLYKRRALEVILDLVLFALAYYGAYLLRYDGTPPASQKEIFEQTLALVVASRLIAFGLVGVYRGGWRQITVVDAHRLLKASLLGSLLSVALIVFLFRDASFARSIFVIDLMLAAILTVGARASFRSLDMIRYALIGGRTPTLIYGAGAGGSLLLREIRSNLALDLEPAGFIDDDPHMPGRLIDGVPVVCGGGSLRPTLEKNGIKKVVIATDKLAPERRQELEAICRELHIELLAFRFWLEPVLLRGTPARTAALRAD